MKLCWALINHPAYAGELSPTEIWQLCGRSWQGQPSRQVERSSKRRLVDGFSQIFTDFEA